MSTPVELKQFGPSQLGVVWDDGHHSLITVRNLRLACKCASCVDEWTRQRRIQDENVPYDVRPVRIETVGRYALRVDWSDGHATGIFPFEMIRNLCECPKCKAARAH